MNKKIKLSYLEVKAPESLRDRILRIDAQEIKSQRSGLAHRSRAMILVASLFFILFIPTLILTKNNLSVSLVSDASDTAPAIPSFALNERSASEDVYICIPLRIETKSYTRLFVSDGHLIRTDLASTELSEQSDRIRIFKSAHIDWMLKEPSGKTLIIKSCGKSLTYVLSFNEESNKWILVEK